MKSLNKWNFFEIIYKSNLLILNIFFIFFHFFLAYSIKFGGKYEGNKIWRKSRREKKLNKKNRVKVDELFLFAI